MIRKFIFILILFLIAVAQASVVPDVDKKSHLFQSFSLLTEEGQSAFYYQGGNRYWGAVGSHITLFEEAALWGRPQLVLDAGVQASLRKEYIEFLSDTLDVRVAISGLFTITPTTRMLISIGHLSGHVLEDVPDKDLIPTNVGDDAIRVRVIHDYKDHLRFGGTLKYIFSTVGEIKKFNADQFIEWLPVGEKNEANNSTGSPFTAIGLEENGIDKYILTTHLQAGLYWGNHFNEKHSDVFRLSLGWYKGLDPRQKYAHYKKNQSSFNYIGLAYEY
jgi:hypothetical protein